mmetsp:Transcript_13226/g.55566  ORF Transcript_13226/g.55566 Transcript_13226/m.55566 type:complete len:222 (-) Transcript_13226:403-1068(-)
MSVLRVFRSVVEKKALKRPPHSSPSSGESGAAGGGGGAPPSAAAMLWMSNPGGHPALIAAVAPGAPYNWLAIAAIAVGLEKSACMGFAAAPGKPAGRPAGTVPGTAFPFSVSRFAAFAPSPASSPASFFPRARLRLAGAESSPPASAARLARSKSASATSCSFSLATFALGFGFGFGRAPFLPSDELGSGRFRTVLAFLGTEGTGSFIASRFSGKNNSAER